MDVDVWDGRQSSEERRREEWEHTEVTFKFLLAIFIRLYYTGED